MRSRAWVGVVATVAVAALIVAGLFAAGSPATARKFRLDRDRKDRLSQLHSVLASYARQNGSLPPSLEELRPTEPGVEFSARFDPRRDPESGSFFEYERLSAREYRVCARFLTSSADRRNEGYYGYGPEGQFEHKAGRNCYERRLTDQELESEFYPRPPGTVIPPVPARSPSPRPEAPSPSPVPQTPAPSPVPATPTGTPGSATSG